MVGGSPKGCVNGALRYR